MADEVTFAGRLAALRAAAGLSAYELARRSGVSKQALSRLERGEREPAWKTVVALAGALGVPTDAFLPGGGPHRPEPPTPDEPARPRGRPRKADRPGGVGPKVSGLKQKGG